MSNPSEIQKKTVGFYKNLYESELSHGNAVSVVLGKLPQMSEGANADLSKALTLKELERDLQSMECGKAA